MKKKMQIEKFDTNKFKSSKITQETGEDLKNELKEIYLKFNEEYKKENEQIKQLKIKLKDEALKTIDEWKKKVDIRKNSDGRKLVGFYGYSRNNAKKHLFKKRFYTIVKNKLYKSKNIKDLNALKQYENNYDYLPKELENYFDGEVSILLVDKNYRGKSIYIQKKLNINQ